MYDIESAWKISQFRHRELIQQAERERLIKLARLNQSSDQSLVAKITDLFKPCPANGANKGKTSRQRSISDPCCIVANSDQ